MPTVQLKCTVCSYRAKRELLEEAGSRGVHETACEPARCPHGHGQLARVDGGRVDSEIGFRRRR